MHIQELRQKWEKRWQIKPHNRIGRKMLETSLEYKIKESEGHKLKPEHQKKLKQLIQSYKRNPNCLKKDRTTLKPGTKIIREWQGVRHTVTVTNNGFEYKNTHYKSLSKIASQITGTKWNGWIFFKLK